MSYYLSDEAAEVRLRRFYAEQIQLILSGQRSLENYPQPVRAILAAQIGR